MKIEEKDVKIVLKHLGIAPHMSGYRYLTTAISMTVNDPRIISEMTKVLYVDVARIHSTSLGSVERAMRHAIEMSYDNAPIEVIDRLLGNTVSKHKGKPSNRLYIAALTDAILDGRYDRLIKASRYADIE